MYDDFDDNYELLLEFITWLKKETIRSDLDYDDILVDAKDTIMEFLLAREKGD
jgi:hypothetical protein